MRLRSLLSSQLLIEGLDKNDVSSVFSSKIVYFSFNFVPPDFAVIFLPQTFSCSCPISHPDFLLVLPDYCWWQDLRHSFLHVPGQHPASGRRALPWWYHRNHEHDIRRQWSVHKPWLVLRRLHIWYQVEVSWHGADLWHAKICCWYGREERLLQRNFSLYFG